MNADLVCWGSGYLETKAEAATDGTGSIFFEEKIPGVSNPGVLRVFMTPDQMQVLKEQIEEALAKLASDP